MSYAQWNPSTTYNISDIVEYAGFIYIATAANQNVAPQPTNPTWTLTGGSGGGGIVNTITAGNPNITIGGTATNVVLSGTLVNLTGNVATSNFALSGNTAGNPSFVLSGTEEFKVITSDLTPHILVSGGVSGGVQLGLPSGYGGYKITAPTVVPPTTSDTQVATTAFVQSALASSGNVASITAGANIGITGTANVPIVGVLAPLTSVLNIGEQQISGASTVGDDTNSITIVAQNGVSVSSDFNYSNAVSQQAGNLSSILSSSTANQSATWTDTPLGTTHTYVNATSASDNALQVVATGTVQGTTATRTDITNISGFNDSLSLVDTLNTQTTTSTKIVNGSIIQEDNQFINPTTSISNSISETINPSSIVSSKSLNNAGNVGSSNITLQPTSSYFTMVATGNSGFLTASNEQQFDSTRARIRIKNGDTSGPNPILNQNDLYCSPVSTYYEQQSKNIAGSSITTTLASSATSGGAILNTDGTLGITSTGNMNLASSSGSILVASLSISGNSITAVPANTDLDLTTNGTGAVHITQAVGNANGALRITQSASGGATVPAVKVINTNAGNSSVAVELFKNGSAGVAGDEVARLSIFGKNSGNTKEEYGRITCQIRDSSSAPTGADGQLLLAVPVGDAMTTFIDLNGSDNRVKILRALLLTNVPTSSAGLPTGAVWSNAGVLNIVP